MGLIGRLNARVIGGNARVIGGNARVIGGAADKTPSPTRGPERNPEGLIT